MFTQRHYYAIADFIKQFTSDNPTDKPVIRNIVTGLSRLFASDNPRYKADRFLKYVGYPPIEVKPATEGKSVFEFNRLEAMHFKVALFDNDSKPFIPSDSLQDKLMNSVSTICEIGTSGATGYYVLLEYTSKRDLEYFLDADISEVNYIIANHVEDTE